ncbi:nucleotidyltransferase family protein [Pseudophaeobacter leonis]|uniref:nucleotidyltransferase family protein n=1 Tax=Pseudophaeobacter leonis TaxID=1144477 RepID=UPI0009F67EAE|nr:nucleotidyltransferase family protein [Pseudophaeobacter leonis]
MVQHPLSLTHCSDRKYSCMAQQAKRAEISAEPIAIAPERADRFAWFFGPADAVPSIPFTPDQLEPACALLLRNWNVLPVTAPKLFSWVGAKYGNSPEANHVRDVTAAVRALARMQTLLINRLANELEAQGIPYVLMKGASASLVLYPEADLRRGLDADIGVPKQYIKAAEQIANQQGFVAAAFDEENRHAFRVDEIAKDLVEAEHYELACLNRRQIVQGLSPEDDAASRRSIPFPRPWHETEDGDLACYVTLDIHHGICLDIEVDAMVETAQRVTRHGYSAMVPQPEWMMLQLIFKSYWEGVHRFNSRGIYQYADLVRLVEHIKGDTAERLFALLEFYELEAGAFYVWRAVETQLGGHLTPELADFVERHAIPPIDRLPSEVNDQGDMWPRLWGFR